MEDVDCVTITFCCGQHLVPMYPMIVGLLERLTQNVSKTLNVWLYGTGLPAMGELARQLQPRGLPAYLAF